MFEKPHEPIATRAVFYRRMFYSLLLVILLVCAALIAGMIGYHITAGLSWLDSFLNASMILSDMGLVAQLTNPAAKVFAACYALFSGLIFVTIIGILFAPILHRFFHTFHKL